MHMHENEHTIQRYTLPPKALYQSTDSGGRNVPRNGAMHQQNAVEEKIAGNQPCMFQNVFWESNKFNLLKK